MQLVFSLIPVTVEDYGKVGQFSTRLKLIATGLKGTVDNDNADGCWTLPDSEAGHS